MRPQQQAIGPGSLAGIGALLAELAPRKVLLVTGCASYTTSGAQRLIEPALDLLKVVRFGGVAANPKIEDIERGIALWRQERPDIIVAAGGGSVLDVAKLVGQLGPSAASWDAFPSAAAASNVEATPLIAIPTTAGSGAQATRFATFYAAGEKRSISHPSLRPSHVIVDPLLTASMPQAVAAGTGLDALAQAVESLWAVGATPESQALAEAALREIVPCLGNLARASTPELRARMAHGSHLAGQAIDLSRTTAAHALSYVLTTDLNLAHGHAVALLLPPILRIIARPEGRRIRDPRGAAYVAATVDRVLHLLGCRDGEDAARFVERHVADLGLATHLDPMGVSATALARRANADRLDNNPVVLSQDDAAGIYEGLFQRRAAA